MKLPPKQHKTIALGTWTEEHGITDEQLAIMLKVTRVQANRIRRGMSYASVKTAKRIEEITGIVWETFVRDGA